MSDLWIDCRVGGAENEMSNACPVTSPWGKSDLVVILE